MAVWWYLRISDDCYIGEGVGCAGVRCAGMGCAGVLV